MTALWTPEELKDATGGVALGTLTQPGAGVCIDSRTLEPGDIFIALAGEKSDGHDHVATALEKGASLAIVHRPEITKSLPPGAPVLCVQDTLKALWAMGRFARARFSGSVIAVTGSVGKTTTKDMLKLVLSCFGVAHAAAASYNNHLGVPLTLARLPRGARFCICEIGMNHEGEIAPLAALVRPHIGIITTVGAAHLGNMGSLEAIAQEKGTLLAALEGNGTALVPDDAIGQEFFKAAAQARNATLHDVGLKPGSHVFIKDPALNQNGSSFALVTEGRSVNVELHAPGMHLVRNAAMVMGAVQALGLDMPTASLALAGFRQGAGRGLVRPILNSSASVLDESYNASSLSMRASLEVLGLMKARRRVAVLGDILELGRFAREEHLALVPSVQECADLVFCCGEGMKHVFEKLPEQKQGGWAESARALGPLVQQNAQPGDIILVKGSNGMHMRGIVHLLLHMTDGGQAGNAL